MGGFDFYAGGLEFGVFGVWILGWELGVWSLELGVGSWVWNRVRVTIFLL